MRDVQASAEVADMIGVDSLDRLRHSPAYGPFTCWHCGLRGDANTEAATVIAELGPRDAYTEATTVIAQRDEGAARTALAHAECSPSQVVSTGAATPIDLTEPGTAARSGGAGHWRTMLADLPGPNGFLPLLILDLRPEMAVRGGPDERVTLCISALLDMGLTPVSTISEEVAEALDNQTEGTDPRPWAIPRAAGWRFELSGRRVARLTAADGSVVWGGAMSRNGGRSGSTSGRRLPSLARKCYRTTKSRTATLSPQAWPARRTWSRSSHRRSSRVVPRDRGRPT